MAPENKSNTTTSRFKSRFSILSLLPSRHPPLIVSHPPLPPTRSVESRHPTIVSSSTISPVHSEYPSPSTPFPLTPLKKTSPHRPPPLDLDRTRMMYPPSLHDVVIDPGTAKLDPAAAEKKNQGEAPPLLKKEKEKEKKTKTTKVSSDPFEIAEVEVGHRYPSWQGGKVDIKPDQVIPRNMVPTRSEKRQTQSEADNYESVLHNVLLTPTYLGPSPTLIPTPSPSSSPSYSPGGGESSKRRTLVDRAANTIYNAARRSRHSHWMPKSILKNTEAARSLQALREREEQEMDRFRRAATSHSKSARLTVPSTPQGSRSFSSGASPIREMNGTHRRSPGWLGHREWDIGYEGKRARVVSGETGWRDRRKKEEKANRRQKIWKYSIAIIILCLAALTIGLCTSLLTKSDKSSSNSTSSDSASSSASVSATTTATSTSASASASSTSTSQTLSTCLSLFTSSAPTSPTTYPCSDCVPLLESTMNDFSQNIVNGNATGVGSALQFCALMDIYKSGGGSSLSSGGWGKDASPCGEWTGISCDSRGRITGVSLTYPDVPNVLPSTLGNIYALESLHLQGNSSVPTGFFPGNLLSLPNFTTLDLQYTALTGSISSTSFTDAKGLTTLNLVNNKELGTSLPDLSKNTNLLTLSATGQNLTSINEDNLPTSLTYLDLSYNSLKGEIPSFSKQTSLITLYLEDNDFTTLPNSLPSTLQSLSLTSNTDLSGNIPSSVCSSTILSSCDLRNTGLKPSTSISTSTAAELRIRATINSKSTSTSAVSTSSLSSTSTSTSSLSSSTMSSAATASTSTSSAACGVCQFS